MSRRRWKYSNGKTDDDNKVLGAMLFSELVTKKKLSLWQPTLGLDTEPLAVSFRRFETMFDPMVWQGLKKYYQVSKPRTTKKEAARLAGLSVYKFGKELKRLNTLIELAVSTWY